MKVTKKTKRNGGFIVTLELLLISTILILGMITGLAVVRDAVVSELQDVADAINTIDQSYSYDGLVFEGGPIGGDCFGFVAGSFYDDDPEEGNNIFCIPPQSDAILGNTPQP